MRMTLPLAIAGTLLLAACNGGRDDDDVPVENVMNDVVEMPEETGPLAPPENLSNVVVPENKVDAPTISEEQQIQDDAEASGMTSRLPDDDQAPALGANDPSAAGSGQGQR